MSRKLYIVLLVAFVGFVNGVPNQDEKTNDTNKVAADEDPKIIGGVAASPNQFPYMVSIQEPISDREWFPFCGGSIISQRTILTAAHCFVPTRKSPLRIVAGSVHSTDISSAGQIGNVVKQIVHNDYFLDERGNLFNDIALVILGQPLTYTSSVQPIALPKQPPVVGNTGTVAGWGDTVANEEHTASLQLLYIRVKIYPISDCEARFGPLRPPSQICIDSPTGLSPISVQTTCRGDSGGPVVMDDSAQGVVSFGATVCGETRTVFTSVYYFMNWIQQWME